jgi:hypothetical protein
MEFFLFLGNYDRLGIYIYQMVSLPTLTTVSIRLVLSGYCSVSNVSLKFFDIALLAVANYVFSFSKWRREVVDLILGYNMMDVDL